MTTAAIFFDFDGVILDSVEIKTDVMRQLFASEEPSATDAIVKLHRQHAGISRYRKFEMIHSDILRRPLTAEASAELGRRFESLAVDAILGCDEIRGARAVLERYADKIPLFVVSGTPENELRGIVERRGFGRYFVSVQGSPRSKDVIVKDLLSRHSLEAGHCLFVGDAMTDYEAARSCGVPFLGVVASGQDNLFARETVVVSDLSTFEFALARVGSRGQQEAVGTRP